MATAIYELLTHTTSSKSPSARGSPAQLGVSRRMLGAGCNFMPRILLGRLCRCPFPCPSRPSSPQPNVYTSPFDKPTMVCSRPQLTSTTVAPANASTNVGSERDSRSPRPRRPCFARPHVKSRPDELMQAACAAPQSTLLKASACPGQRRRASSPSSWLSSKIPHTLCPSVSSSPETPRAARKSTSPDERPPPHAAVATLKGARE